MCHDVADPIAFLEKKRVRSESYWNSRWEDGPALTVDLTAYQSVQVRDLLLFGRALFRSLGISNSRTLDVGGGNGRVARFFGLQGDGLELHVVDISAEAIKSAVQAGCYGCQVDIESSPLPYPSDFFDVVLCQEVIEHLMRPQLILSETHRVLRPGGYFYITTPNLAALGDRFLLLLGIKPLSMSWDPTHIRFYRFQDLQAELVAQRFVVDRCATQGVYLPVRLPVYWKYIRVPLLHRIRYTLGQHVIILARKAEELS